MSATFRDTDERDREGGGEGLDSRVAQMPYIFFLSYSFSMTACPEKLFALTGCFCRAKERCYAKDTNVCKCLIDFKK